MQFNHERAFAVAKRILHADPSADAMKIEKLLYYVQGWTQAWTGRPVFNEPPEAWVYGPVYPFVYRDWGKYERRQIEAADISLLSTEELAMIDAVVAAYESDDAVALMERTHEEPPWNEAREGLAPSERSTRVISLTSMMVHFSTVDGPKRPVCAEEGLDEGFVPVDDSFMQAESQRWAGLLARLGS